MTFQIMKYSLSPESERLWTHIWIRQRQLESLRTDTAPGEASVGEQKDPADRRDQRDQGRTRKVSGWTGNKRFNQTTAALTFKGVFQTNKNTFSNVPLSFFFFVFFFFVFFFFCDYRTTAPCRREAGCSTSSIRGGAKQDVVK